MGVNEGLLEGFDRRLLVGEVLSEIRVAEFLAGDHLA